VLTQVNEAAEQIYDLVDATANLIFGAVVDPNMPNGEVCMDMLAAGCIDSSRTDLKPQAGQSLAVPSAACRTIAYRHPAQPNRLVPCNRPNRLSSRPTVNAD